MCLEFDGTVYLIQNMDPTSLYTVPTVLEDCWVFRATDCAGEVLLEHHVTGTRKLTIGCTKEATDANAVDVAISTPLDCSLTMTPKLSDVFDATLDFVPLAKVSDVDNEGFDEINDPMQFIEKDELLRGMYEMCFDLARHGIDVQTSLNFFRHVRAVIWHTESCHQELVGAKIGFAQAYIGLYGAAVAVLHASNELAGTWIDVPDPLTSEQNAALQALIDHAVGINVDLELPSSAMPTTLHGLSANGNLGGVRTIVRQAASPSPSSSPSASTNSTGEDICNGQGNSKWKFHKMSKPNIPNSTLDCCSKACFAFGTSARFITRPFITNCCLSCNMGWCSDVIPARTLAVMQIGEVQLPTNSTVALRLPVKVMV